MRRGHCVEAIVAKLLFQIGADKRTVRLLRNDRLSPYGRGLRLEFMPGLAWAVVRRGICGIMPDVPDRPPLGAPTGEEPTDLALRIGVISLAPTGMINRALQVDQQKYGTAWGKWGTHVDRPEICESIGWSRRGRKAGRNRRYSTTTAAAARRCRTNPAALWKTPKVCIGCTSAARQHYPKSRWLEVGGVL